ADQLRRGENAVLSVKQSAFRGSGSNPTLTLISFNPPANARNWANRYAREQQPGKLVHHSSYLDAPRDWLGKEFLDGADWLRKTKPLKYRHMYLGEMVGSGTQV
ncbi:phage terminase large subunit, partial [Ruthenibacterium lactatiformans]